MREQTADPPVTWEKEKKMKRKENLGKNEERKKERKRERKKVNE